MIETCLRYHHCFFPGGAREGSKSSQVRNILRSAQLRLEGAPTFRACGEWRQSHRFIDGRSPSNMPKRGTGIWRGRWCLLPGINYR